MGRSLSVAVVLAVLMASCGGARSAAQARDLLQRAELSCQEAEDLEWGLLCYGDGPTVVAVIDDPEFMREKLRLLTTGNLRDERPLVASPSNADEGWFLVVPEGQDPEAVAGRLGGVVLRGAEEIRAHADALVRDG